MNEVETEQDVEMAYNFVINFHKIRPDFLKGTCWERLHKDCLEMYEGGWPKYQVYWETLSTPNYTAFLNIEDAEKELKLRETSPHVYFAKIQTLELEDYLSLLAQRVARISQEKDFVGLYHKYTEQKGTKSHTHTV